MHHSITTTPPTGHHSLAASSPFYHHKHHITPPPSAALFHHQHHLLRLYYRYLEQPEAGEHGVGPGGGGVVEASFVQLQVHSVPCVETHHGTLTPHLVTRSVTVRTHHLDPVVSECYPV